MNHLSLEEARRAEKELEKSLRELRAYIAYLEKAPPLTLPKTFVSPERFASMKHPWQAAIIILREEGRPMSVPEIVARMEQGGYKLGAKSPIGYIKQMATSYGNIGKRFVVLDFHEAIIDLADNHPELAKKQGAERPKFKDSSYGSS